MLLPDPLYHPTVARARYWLQPVRLLFLAHFANRLYGQPRSMLWHALPMCFVQPLLLQATPVPFPASVVLRQIGPAIPSVAGARQQDVRTLQSHVALL